MKKLFWTLALLPISLFISSQTTENPFEKLGYKPLVATLTRGEFEEFHDREDIVEIGSVLFDTKIMKIVKILNKGETTIDIPAATAAMSIDPHCERYYWISPYAYAANNPIKYIDPDGRDIWIYYKDENGDKQHFVFNGTNHADAPKNNFVADALIAYDYNIANGGGENLVALATSDKYTMKLQETVGIESSASRANPTTGEYIRTTWDSREAIKTDDGYTMSPATVLEHEAAHTLSTLQSPSEHKKRKEISDSSYGNKEENRVIPNIEAPQARKNGEYPTGYVRPNHEGTSVRVSTPITNGVLRAKPIQFLFKNAGKYKY